MKNNFAFIITENKTNRRAGCIKKKGKGVRELRYLLNHLRSGGKIIMLVDVFNDFSDCPARFFDRERNVSMLPARLAKLADVPLVTAVPELSGKIIHIRYGPQFDVDRDRVASSVVMQELLAFFEDEIKRNPSIWSEFVREPLSKHKSE